MKTFIKVLLLIIAVSFTSCKSSDKLDDNWIVGEWVNDNGGGSVTFADDFHHVIKKYDGEVFTETMAVFEKVNEVWGSPVEYCYRLDDSYFEYDPSTKTAMWYDNFSETGPYRKIVPIHKESSDDNWIVGTWENEYNDDNFFSSFTITEDYRFVYGNDTEDSSPKLVKVSSYFLGPADNCYQIQEDWYILFDPSTKTAELASNCSDAYPRGPYHYVKPITTNNQESTKATKSTTNNAAQSFSEPDDNFESEKEEVVFRTVYDVTNYLGKHSFTNSDGCTLYFKPSGIVRKFNGQSGPVTGAIKISVEDDVAAFVTAHSPLNNADFTFVVNCSRGFAYEVNSDTYYYED